MNVLTIDVGGTHVKLLAAGQKESRRFNSGKDLTPGALVGAVREHARDWDYDAVSLGYPGLVGKDGPKEEPENLGGGWVGFDFAAALGKPVKVVNDAVMQALGSYQGGRMLFLGLGTAVGSTLIVHKVVVPLELGQLPFRDATLVDYLGHKGLERLGEAVWRQALAEVVRILQGAFAVDHVVLGGGNGARVDPLPEGANRGGNENAFEGGFRLWEMEVVHVDREDAALEVWRVVY
jgi:polyphosphate glucokinase